MSVLIVIPVFNEEVRLPRCIPKLHEFLTRQVAAPWEIVIANNASTDRTQAVAERFCREYPHVRILWLPQKGRGGALKKVWLESDADILSYMDVDLSTGLDAFPVLVEAIAARGYDLAIGSRLTPGAHTERCRKRELISRTYLLLIRMLCHARLTDAQCGFKAISRKAAQVLLPIVEDTDWFFDTELLVWAKRLDYRIWEAPVRWVEDRDSRVNLFGTAKADFLGLLRLRRKLRKTRSLALAPACCRFPSDNDKRG